MPEFQPATVRQVGQFYLQIYYDGLTNTPHLVPSAMTGTLPVEQGAPQPGTQIATEDPAPIPSNPAQQGSKNSYGQSPAKREMTVLPTQIMPVSACLGGTTEPVLAAYNEYSYGVVWCPNSNPPGGAKSAKKNYHYLFNNGEQVQFLTMNFDGATESAAMPSAVVAEHCN